MEMRRSRKNIKRDLISCHLWGKLTRVGYLNQNTFELALNHCGQSEAFFITFHVTIISNRLDEAPTGIY